MKKYFWSMLSFLMVAMLSTSFLSCGDDGGGDNGPETTLGVSPLSFTLSNSGNDVKSIAITSNAQWTLSSLDSWIHCSQYSGNGNASVDVQADANTGTQKRTATLTITANDKSLTVQVTQEAGSQSCGATPSDVLRFSDAFVTNYECDDDVKFFFTGVYMKNSLATITEAELKRDLQESGVRRSAEQAKYPVYTSDLSPNTTYTLVTLSYDKNDKLRDIVKTDISTKKSTAQPEVELYDADLSGDGNYLYWTITAKKGSNGYCAKFYTWVASGTTMTSQLFPPQTICWYLAKEIKRSPSAHTTNIHASLDEYIKYISGYNITSDVTEYLDGPKMQETATTNYRGMPNPEGLYYVLWGIDDAGELSGKVTGGYVDFTDVEDAPKRLSARAPAWQKTRYEADKYSLLPLLK